MDIRIYYEDTDCGQVVYYANYLRIFERARTEYLRGLGVDVAHWMDEGLLFTVTHAEVDYHAPARYGDVIHVRTAVTESDVKVTVRPKGNGTAVVIPLRLFDHEQLFFRGRIDPVGIIGAQLEA